MKKSTVNINLKIPTVGILLIFCLCGISGQEPVNNIAPERNTVSDEEILIEIPSPSDEETLSGNYVNKSTGVFYLSDNTNYALADGGSKSYVFTPSDPLPDGAYVTSVEYYIRIDDNGDESNFYPYDYEIWLSSASHEGYKFLCVYDQEGISTSHTDEGFDDDLEDDSDIFLNYRSTDAFDNEPAIQDFKVYIKDNVLDGEGIVDAVYLAIHWFAPDPRNLNANHTPEGWSAPMVINQVEGSNSSAAFLFANIPSYVDASFRVEENDFPVGALIKMELRIDGEFITEWGYWGASAGAVRKEEDIEYTFTAGDHVVCQVADPDNFCLETNETDNQYCQTYTFIGPPSTPLLLAPANGMNSVPTTMMFDWMIDEYFGVNIIEIDDNSDFSSPVVAGFVEEDTVTCCEVSGLDSNVTYFWHVKAYNQAGVSEWSDTWQFTTVAAVPSAITEAPSSGYYLKQNYPNPFMKTTTIEFRLPVESKVDIEFLNMQGKQVESFSGYFNAGIHSVEITLTQELQPGVYFYRIRTSGYTDSRMCIVR